MGSKHVLMLAEHTYNLIDDSTNLCDSIPETLPGPMTCLFNPVYLLCATVGTGIVTAARAVYFAIQLAHDILESAFEKGTMSPGQEIDTSLRVQDISDNVDKFSKWNRDALETININVFKQHSEMRKHLQDRHQEMTSDIVETIEDSTNVITGYFRDQSEWLQENLCVIYKKINDKKNCDGNDSLMSLIGVSLWDSIVGLESQGSKMKHDIMQQVDSQSTALKEMKHEMQELKDEMIESQGSKMKHDIMQQVDRQSIALKEMKHEIQGTKDHMKELIKEHTKTKDTMKELMGEMKGMTGMLTELVEQNKKMFGKDNQ